MPRASPLSAPTPGDPDRKRVLNVLAQRRYRERRKQRYAALEQQAKSGSSASASADSSTSPESFSEQNVTEVAPQSCDLPSNLGVSLLGFQDDAFSGGFNPVPCRDEVDFSFNMMMNSGDMSGGSFEFINELSQAPSNQPPACVQPNVPPTSTMSMDAIMDVHPLKLLQVTTTFAQAIGCKDLMHDATALWVMPMTTIPGLPPNMQPTQAQLTIPHHPFFDTLPWPHMRTKLIWTFSVPEQMRPPNARSPTALMEVAFDIEDDKDGFRINGAGLNGDDWEVGEAFFKNWWWCLDRTIIETSNTWRRKRGQRLLGM